MSPRTSTPLALPAFFQTMEVGWRETATVVNTLLRRFAALLGGHVEAAGSGADYALTTSFAVLAFGGGNLEVELPLDGDYIVSADIAEDASGVTASAGANQSLFWLYRNAVAETGGARLGMGFPALIAALAGVNEIGHHYEWRVAGEAGDLVSLHASKAGATTGAWTILAGYSTLAARRA